MSKSRAASQRRKLWSLLAAMATLFCCCHQKSEAQSLPANFSTFKLTDPTATLSSLSNGTAHVIITLVPPPLALGINDYASPAFLSSLRPQIKRVQQSILAALPAKDVRVGFQFENIAGFSAVVTKAGLQALQTNSQVALIEPVRTLESHLAQGISLMHADTFRSSYNGAGISIAICDTGVDYNHSKLGGGGFPNSKVIGGYNFGDGNSDPLPNANAHGTAAAGIAAGDLGTVGDYIGGVAYNAKLYALKISASTNGTANTADMIAAWDWCVTHKNDDPNNPIMVISTSFGSATGLGGQRFFSTCDNESPSMTTAAANAAAAGITIFSSSGNDGFCDSIAWPSCISSVIAVGSVYDANFGTSTPCVSSVSCVAKTSDTNCSSGYHATDSTDADVVPSYSNVSQILGLLTPADQCYTLDISGADGYSSGDYCPMFGGTSAACAYAAGAAACLQQAAKTITGSYLTPLQVRNLLIEYGDNITDPKATITKPRVNLARAIQHLVAAPLFKIVSTSVSGGNGNANLDTNECANLSIIIRNDGFSGATNVSAILSSASPGVNIAQSNSTYPNLPVGSSATNNSSFSVSTSPAFVYGTIPNLKLVLNYNGGSATNWIRLGPGEYEVLADFASIVPGTADTGNHGDDTLTTLALPFGFTFYDQTFSNAVLSANGNIQFRSANYSGMNACLPHSGVNYAILPYWSDLRTDGPGSGIFTSTSGAAPNRIFNIEWRANNFNGEVRLYENQSRLDVIYGNTADGGASATIGIQKDTGSAFTLAGCNANVVSNGLRFIFRPTAANGGGQCGAPYLDFTGGPTNGVLPLTVGFTNLSIAATNFVWSFGDGGTSTNLHPSHIYTNAGVYTVSVSAHNAIATNWFSRVAYVVVTNPPPIVNFAGVPTNGSAPLTVNFTNLSLYATDYAWDFGNGDQSTNTNPSEIFLNPGTYSITLTATGTGGTSSLTLTNYVTVLIPPMLMVTPPSADFGIITTGGVAYVAFSLSNGGEATLHGTASVDGGPFAVLNAASNAVPGFSFLIPGSATTNIVLRFAPTTANAFTNAAIFVTDGGNSTNEISGRSLGSLIAKPMLHGTDFIFTFSTVTGFSYVVEYKDDLSDPSWQPLEWVTGDGSTVSVTNSILSGTQRFFRITAQ